MKKINYLFIGVFVLLLFSTSCGDDDEVIIVDDIDNVDDNGDIDDDATDDTGDDDDNNDDADNTSGFEEVDITVVLPEDSSLDLTTTVVRSLASDFEVSADGNSTALHIKERRGLAFLTDGEDNVLLMGFVTDNRREISVRSTVEVSLYFGLGTIFQLQEARDIYFTEISTGINIDDLVNQVSTMFVSNPNLIDSNEFSTFLSNTLANLNTDPDPIDIRAANEVQNLTFSSRIRSGVELIEEPTDNVRFRNGSRRRAHAFFYKTRSTDEAGNETILLGDIATENQRAVMEVPVDPAAGVNSVIGTVINIIRGKGGEIIANNSNPTRLMIDNDELSGTYMARLVGPGFAVVGNNRFTDLEEERIFQLNLETVAFDVVLPVIGLALSIDESAFSNIRRGDIQPFFNAFNALVSTFDPLNAALRSGDLNAARTAFFMALRDGSLSSFFEPLIRTAADFAIQRLDGASVSIPANIINGVENLFLGLKIADGVLATVDLLRVFNSLLTSNSLEEWEITVDRSNVVLTPEEASSSFNGNAVILTANAEDIELGENQFLEFVWTSTGDFGSLNGTTTGGSSLSDRTTITTTSTTSTSQITYEVEDLGEGEEEITVEVFLREGQNRTRINDDFAIIQVLPTELVLRPDDATIEGGGALVLFVEDEDGNDFTQSEDFQYAIVWETAGSFGQFNGNENIITEIDENSIRYQALEMEDEGEEVVTANIYRRPRGSLQSFRFLQAIDATVNIENDPNTITFIVGPSFEVIPIVQNFFFEGGVNSNFEFDPLEASDSRIPEGMEVASYTIRIRERIPDARPSCTFSREVFTVRDDGTIDPDEFNRNGRLAVICGGGSFSIPEGIENAAQLANARLAELVASAGSIRGFAEVTVWLREAN